MNSDPIPRPWRFEDRFNEGFPVLIDASEHIVATSDSETPELVARLICDAVNAYDKLRALVKRLSDLTWNLLANYEERYRDDQNSTDFVKDARELVEDARKALGEG